MEHVREDKLTRKTRCVSMCKEIEKERKPPCDLLAWRIRDYVDKLNDVRRRSGRNWERTGNDLQLHNQHCQGEKLEINKMRSISRYSKK